MSNLTDFLSREVPWLLPALAWIGGILLILLILAVPAYFVFWPFLERARAQLASLISRLVEKFKSRHSEQAESLNKAADEFLEDGGLWRLKSEASGHWTAQAGGLKRVLKKLLKQIGKVAKSLHKLDKSVSALQNQVQQSKVAEPRSLPQLPATEEIIESAASIRVAWMRFILALVILLGLMLVNTGMLSQILLDLSVIPAAMIFLGLQLAYIFAFILTLVEAGLGVVHGATRSNNPEKISILPGIVTVFAVIVACVEGFFYSRVAPSTGTFTLPFLNYQMPQYHLFFSWGFVLVMTLFCLGLIGFEAGATILRGTRSNTLRREMKKLQRGYQQFNGTLKLSQEAITRAKAKANEADQAIQGPAANAETVHEELNRVSRQIDALKGTIPEWAKDNEAALTRTEVHQLAQTGGLWLLLSLLGMVIITITGLDTLHAFYPNLQPLTLWVVAIGQALVFIGIGLLLGAGEIIVSGGEGERKVHATPKFTRWLAYFLGGSLVLTYIALFFISVWPIGLGGVWFLNLLTGLFLVAGYQLCPLLNVIRLWLRRVWNILVLVLETLWLAIVRLLQFVLIVLENVAYLLATPLVKIFHRRQGTIEPGLARRESGEMQKSSSRDQKGGNAI